MPTPQRSVMSMIGAGKGPGAQLRIVVQRNANLAELGRLVDGGRGEPQASLEVRHADHPHGHLLADRHLGKPLARHFRRELEIALGDESEQRLGPRRGHRARPRRSAGDDARHRRIDVDRRTAAVERGEPHQRLSGFDGLAGLGEHLRDLHPLALGPDQHLLPRHEDAGDLDRILEAGALRLHHRHRGARPDWAPAPRPARRRPMRPTAPAQAAADGDPPRVTAAGRQRPRTTLGEEGSDMSRFRTRGPYWIRATPTKIALRRARQRRPRATGAGPETSLG